MRIRSADLTHSSKVHLPTENTKMYQNLPVACMLPVFMSEVGTLALFLKYQWNLTKCLSNL